MTFINQFSGVLAYLVVGLGLLAVILWRIAPQKRRVGLLIGTAVLLFVGLFIFRPETGGVSAVTVQQTLAASNGRPVFLELYSDYCLACRRAKPTVDRLAENWGDEVAVLRLNVQDPSAQPLLAELNFRFTPTFILFDGDGREIWRTNGLINPDEVNEQLEQ